MENVTIESPYGQNTPEDVELIIEYDSTELVPEKERTSPIIPNMREVNLE